MRPVRRASDCAMLECSRKRPCHANDSIARPSKGGIQSENGFVTSRNYAGRHVKNRACTACPAQALLHLSKLVRRNAHCRILTTFTFEENSKWISKAPVE